MIVGLGVDIIEIKRIEQFVSSKSLNQLYRIFTEKECAYALSSQNKYERFAGRFVVKEAFFKAFGSGNFCEIECDSINGKPYLYLHGRTKEEWIKKGQPNLLVSVSHTSLYATATVLIQEITNKNNKD